MHGRIKVGYEVLKSILKYCRSASVYVQGYTKSAEDRKISKSNFTLERAIKAQRGVQVSLYTFLNFDA